MGCSRPERLTVFECGISAGRVGGRGLGDPLGQTLARRRAASAESDDLRTTRQQRLGDEAAAIGENARDRSLHDPQRAPSANACFAMDPAGGARMTRETTSSGADAPTGLVPHPATATRRPTGGVGGALCRPLSSDEAPLGELWIRERFMRARDLRGMTAANASTRAQTGEQKIAICRTFGVRLAADLPCGISSGGRGKASGRLRQDRQQKISICRMFSTGATGLEPATSGVTGLFEGNDDWRRLTRNRSIHAALRASGA